MSATISELKAQIAALESRLAALERGGEPLKPSPGRAMTTEAKLDLLLEEIAAIRAELRKRLTPRVMTKAQYAAELGVSERTVTEYLTAGLPHSKPGGPNGKVYIDPEAAMEWLKGYEKKRFTLAGYRPRRRLK